MKKSKLYLFALLLPLASCDSESDKTHLSKIADRLGKGPKEERVISVKTMTADTLSNIILNTYVGTVEESQSIELNFKYGGTLEQIKVKEGDRVNKGDFIARVSSSALISSQRTAEATLEQAKDGYTRLKKVYDNGSLPEVKWKEMVANLEKAQSSADLANDMVKESTLRAPISGVVASRNAEIGSNISPFQPIVRLINIDGVVVKISVPENEIGKINLDDKATISVAALGDRVYEGKVIEKGMIAAPFSHSYEVKLSIENTDGLLLPGMIGKTSLKSDISNGIVIPCNIVLLNDKEKFIWVVRDGRAHKCPIKISGYSGKGIIVSEGLHQGDSIIEEGYQKVSEGMKVIDHE
jgi:RND family efflux transporter, MFP subunit